MNQATTAGGTALSAKDMILLKEGEVVLKGLNKRYFEQKLTQNIRRRIKPFGRFVRTA